MKQGLGLTAIGALALTIAACGGGSSEAPAPEATTPAETAAPAAEPEAPVEEASAEPEAPAEPEEAPVEEASAEPAAEEPAAEVTEASADGAVVIDGLTGNADNGKRVFTQCMACHAVVEGRNMAGPSLYGIVGRTAGQVDGFRYSDANANSGIVWTEEVMFEYLENPREYIPGTIMAFPGLRKPQDRVDVVAYLKSVPES